MASLPPLSFFVKGSEGLSLLIGPPFNGQPAAVLDRIPCTSGVFSQDGSILAITTDKAIILYDTRSGSKIRELNAANVKAASFSPKGTFLQTFQPPQQSPKNVTIWDVSSGAIAWQQFQKTFSKSAWPTIQFANDESAACRIVTNEVHFFDPLDFSKGIVDRLRLPGIESAQLSATPSTFVAAFVPEIKGSPASVCIYERTKASQDGLVARRSFYKASSVHMLWNRGSTALLVLAQSDVDKSNQSYYGEARLHFLSSNGSYEGSVPLSKEGPVHDVQWSPSGLEFLVVHGFMPACTTLFDAKCKVLFHFPSGPYNTVRWSPHGRFLSLAGFGNLPGDICFWDRTTLKCLGSTRAECSVSSEWSPDTRYFLTATTAPRLQVDNGIRIFKYDGVLCFQKKYEKLYQVEWKPAIGVYEDRPPSPGLDQDDEDKSSASGKVKKGSKGEGGSNKSITVAAKPAAYQAPHLKAAAAVRAQLLGHDTFSSTGELSKSALKNKKRREKQREQKQTEKKESSASSEQDVAQFEQCLEALSSTLNGSDDSSVDETGKRLRALQKKLRQIEDIKLKVEKEAGRYIPNAAQQEKLSQEAYVREELRALQL